MLKWWFSSSTGKFKLPFLHAGKPAAEIRLTTPGEEHLTETNPNQLRSKLPQFRGVRKPHHCRGAYKTSYRSIANKKRQEDHGVAWGTQTVINRIHI